MFRHPNYYKELRKRNKTDQAISDAKATAASERATGPGLKQQASSKPQAPSSSKKEPQASSPKQQASSSKPQATSSWILDPGKSFMVPEPRASTMMNVLLGWRAWNAIWCGENLTLLLFVTFNSSVKKCP